MQQPLRDGWLVQGPRVAEFEAKFAAFCGAEHAVATTSCTTALHVAVGRPRRRTGRRGRSSPRSRGSRRRTSSSTSGATPVFCDVDLRFVQPRLRRSSTQPSPTAPSGSSRCTCSAAPPTCPRSTPPRGAMGCGCSKTPRARSATRQGGRHAGSARRRRLFLLSPAQVDHHRRRRHGGHRRRASWPRLARSLRDHGASRSGPRAPHREAGRSGSPSTTQLGFNYRMTDIQGALGAAQMDRADVDPRRARAPGRALRRGAGDVDVAAHAARARRRGPRLAGVRLLCTRPRSRVSNLAPLRERRDRADARAGGRGDRHPARDARAGGESGTGRIADGLRRSSSRTRCWPSACRSRCRCSPA